MGLGVIEWTIDTSIEFGLSCWGAISASWLLSQMPTGVVPAMSQTSLNQVASAALVKRSGLSL